MLEPSVVLLHETEGVLLVDRDERALEVADEAVVEVHAALSESASASSEWCRGRGR
jgi:hypothetical protein